MAKLKYSILVCAYANIDQFENFLKTACAQDFEDYEIIVVDNATPGDGIIRACLNVESWMQFDQLVYQRIVPTQKQCTNITQGINCAARHATGERFLIIADSNVLLSSNLLAEIDQHNDNQITISGAGTDIKISPGGDHNSEYSPGDHKQIAKLNAALLKEMGWPDDPLNLKLIYGKWRSPDPHNSFDVYAVAMNRSQFTPYNEKMLSWGTYHADYVKAKCLQFGHRRIQNVRIIHQYHRVWKDREANQ